jgi:hypothetical protein
MDFSRIHSSSRSRMLHMYLAHVIIHYFINLVIQIFLRAQVTTHPFLYVSSTTCTSSLVGTSIVLNTLLSDTVNEFHSLTVRDQVPQISALAYTHSVLLPNVTPGTWIESCVRVWQFVRRRTQILLYAVISMSKLWNLNYSTRRDEHVQVQQSHSFLYKHCHVLWVTTDGVSDCILDLLSTLPTTRNST